MPAMPTSAFKIGSAALVCAAMLAQDQPSPTFKTNTKPRHRQRRHQRQKWQSDRRLEEGQFTLLEDGKPQQIAVFELQRLEWRDFAGAGSGPRQRSRHADRPKPKPTPMEPPPPVKADQLKDRRLIAMFFDLSSMQPAETDPRA